MRTLRGTGIRGRVGARGFRAALAVAWVSLAVAAAVGAAEPAPTADEAYEDHPAGSAPEPGRELDRGEHRRWHGHRRGPPPIERVLEEHAERLGLDAESRAEIRRIADASREAADAHRERLRELHEKMREILRKDAPDEGAVMRQADEIGAAETAEQKHRLRTMLEIRALLTPAQRAELVKIHEERRQQRAERHQQRREAGGEPPR